MYKVIVFWQDGRQTVAAESYNPSDLSGAPMVSRDSRVIRRIEIHDLTGSLETVWSADWETTKGR